MLIQNTKNLIEVLVMKFQIGGMIVSFAVVSVLGRVTANTNGKKNKLGIAQYYILVAQWN